ncbi:exported hypothetical protein [Candidatus Sulfopaludibacter sp. SbA3]|nr:exported hypothetical protein [Candidatus Sulfopaludibacter sp. SbA3]
MQRAFTIKTFAATCILAGAGGLGLSQRASPDAVFVSFCELDSQGAQLNPDG